MVAVLMQPNIHDALVKAIFSRVEHAASVLQNVLPPKLAARIDWKTLALCPGSFIDEVLKERYSDLLFSANIGARPGLIYVLFEHQSTSDSKMAFRLLRYEVRIWETWQNANPAAKQLPVIVPVVLHHSEGGWVGSTAFEDLLDADEETLASASEHVPRFRFVLVDISHETDEALRTSAMTELARLVYWCLRHSRGPKELVARFPEWAELVREVLRAPGGSAALVLIMRYIFAVAEPSRPEELAEQLFAALGNVGKEEIMTAAEQLIERGRQEGEQQGRQQERRKMLLFVLNKRFGAVPEAMIARVQAADEAQLDVWVDRMLSAPTLADLLGSA